MAKKKAGGIPLVMTKDEQRALKHTISVHNKLELEVKGIRAEQKKLRTSAYKACGMKPKQIAQLASESLLEVDGTGRKELAYHEQRMQLGRDVLGIALQFDMDLDGSEPAKKAGKGAAEPQHHATKPLHKANGKTGAKAKKGSGKKKPKQPAAVVTTEATMQGDDLLPLH